MIEIGTFCIHTSPREERGCRVVGHDGSVILIKHLKGGYLGALESSLTPCELMKALAMEKRQEWGRE